MIREMVQSWWAEYSSWLVAWALYSLGFSLSALMIIVGMFGGDDEWPS